ncbi:hypothetical protein [Azospirillum picis]|uniref:Terminase small subunit n=1 Tax=Azospirillum picis TaxID=488438 RepID=A0ABU0MEF2_9PROT|nr:hypothetical protein [Azospirillum picis]MBP2297965.1 hypothetical protein [Azospirillum picis]MDQ0531803.1 hypothetical protein [Azospirillum picis]
MSNDRPDDLVGVTEAAAAVGVNKSTVSRYVSQGLLTNYGVSGRPLVSIAAVRALPVFLDPAKRRTSGSAPAAAPADADPAESAPRPVLPTTIAASVETTLANERIRKTRADADRAELENAKAQAQLVERDAAANAGFDLGPALMRLLDERAPDLANRLVGVVDYRTALGVIQDVDRQLLEKWKRQIETTMAEFGLTRTDGKPE